MEQSSSRSRILFWKKKTFLWYVRYLIYFSEVNDVYSPSFLSTLYTTFEYSTPILFSFTVQKIFIRNSLRIFIYFINCILESAVNTDIQDAIRFVGAARVNRQPTQQLSTDKLHLKALIKLWNEILSSTLFPDSHVRCSAFTRYLCWLGYSIKYQ